ACSPEPLQPRSLWQVAIRRWFPGATEALRGSGALPPAPATRAVSPPDRPPCAAACPDENGLRPGPADRAAAVFDTIEWPPRSCLIPRSHARGSDTAVAAAD